jgi:hypothetical protein
MKKGRILQFVDWTLLINAKTKTVTVVFSIDRFGESFSVWMEKADESGINYYVYTTDPFKKSYRNANIVTIPDPGLKRAEDHIKRILEETDNV